MKRYIVVCLAMLSAVSLASYGSSGSSRSSGTTTVTGYVDTPRAFELPPIWRASNLRRPGWSKAERR